MKKNTNNNNHRLNKQRIDKFCDFSIFCKNENARDLISGMVLKNNKEKNRLDYHNFIAIIIIIIIMMTILINYIFYQ